MSIRIEEIPEMRVACFRHVGPYEQINEAFERMTAYLEGKNVIGPDTKFLGIYHDDPETTPASELRSDACFTVDESFQPEGGVKVMTIPSGTYAVYQHKGPYEELGNAWGLFCGKLLPEAGFKVREAPCFEIYMNCPDSVAPSELLTDIYEPVFPK